MSDSTQNTKEIAIKVTGDLKSITALHKERSSDKYYQLGQKSFGILVETHAKRKRYDITRDDSPFSATASKYRIFVDHEGMRNQKNHETLDEILENGTPLFVAEQSHRISASRAQWLCVDQYFTEDGRVLVGKGIFQGVRFGAPQERKLGVTRKCTASRCNGRITIFDEGRYFTLKTDSHICLVKSIQMPSQADSAGIEELSSVPVLDETMREEEKRRIRHQQEEEVKSGDPHVSSDSSSESDDVISTKVNQMQPGRI